MLQSARLFVVIMTKRQHMARLVPSVSIGTAINKKLRGADPFRPPVATESFGAIKGAGFFLILKPWPATHHFHRVGCNLACAGAAWNLTEPYQPQDEGINEPEPLSGGGQAHP